MGGSIAGWLESVLVEADQLLRRVVLEGLSRQERWLGNDGLAGLPGDEEVSAALAEVGIEDLLDPVAEEEVPAAR